MEAQEGQQEAGPAGGGGRGRGIGRAIGRARRRSVTRDTRLDSQAVGPDARGPPAAARIIGEASGTQISMPPSGTMSFLEVAAIVDQEEVTRHYRFPADEQVRKGKGYLLSGFRDARHTSEGWRLWSTYHQQWPHGGRVPIYFAQQLIAHLVHQLPVDFTSVPVRSLGPRTRPGTAAGAAAEGEAVGAAAEGGAAGRVRRPLRVYSLPDSLLAAWGRQMAEQRYAPSMRYQDSEDTPELPFPDCFYRVPDLRAETCPVCLYRLDAHGCFVLGCGHPFHVGCIVHSLSLSMMCPVCRYSIPADVARMLGLRPGLPEDRPADTTDIDALRAEFGDEDAQAGAQLRAQQGALDDMSP